MWTLSYGLMPVATLLGGFVSRWKLRAPLLIVGVATAALALLGARRSGSRTRCRWRTRLTPRRGAGRTNSLRRGRRSALPVEAGRQHLVHPEADQPERDQPEEYLSERQPEQGRHGRVEAARLLRVVRDGGDHDEEAEDRESDPACHVAEAAAEFVNLYGAPSCGYY